MVVSEEKHCVFCNSPFVEVHHIFEGRGRRKLSDKYGLTVYICRLCHNEVHKYPNTGKDLQLKQLGQTYYEDHFGTREQFIKEFVKSYL